SRTGEPTEAAGCACGRAGKTAALDRQKAFDGPVPTDGARRLRSHRRLQCGAAPQSVWAAVPHADADGGRSDVAPSALGATGAEHMARHPAFLDRLRDTTLHVAWTPFAVTSGSGTPRRLLQPPD